ncbi:transcriptional regulator [Sphingobacteriaceae bacterium]|nr:transcriptional regulator [Sphingobacteriaceae bacterium]
MSDQQKFLKSLGKHIDKIRKKQDLSFQELALRCDIEKSNLVKLTSQGSNITVASLYKIAKGLDVPVSELLKF